MSKEKSLFGLWSDMKVADINRLLRPYNVRLVAKGSKEYGEKVVVTAQAIEEPVPASVVGPCTICGAPEGAFHREGCAVAGRFTP